MAAVSFFPILDSHECGAPSEARQSDTVAALRSRLAKQARGHGEPQAITPSIDSTSWTSYMEAQTTCFATRRRLTKSDLGEKCVPVTVCQIGKIASSIDHLLDFLGKNR